jgi:hypothetical protein
MVGSALEVASMFVVYNAAKEALMDPETHHVSLPRVCLAGSIAGTSSHARTHAHDHALTVCPVRAGVATATFLTPVELIKCRLQVQTGGGESGAAARRSTPPAAASVLTAAAATPGGAQQRPQFRGTMHCIMHTIKTEGPFGLWRGWWRYTHAHNSSAVVSAH